MMLKAEQRMNRLLLFFLFFSTFCKAQNVNFSAKGLLFLTDGDMSAFALADGELRKSEGANDLISGISFPLSYSNTEQFKSDLASNSIFNEGKCLAITRNQKLAYVLENRGQTNKSDQKFENIKDEFPIGKYITVVNIEDVEHPKSLYRFPAAGNPGSIALSPQNNYLAVVSEEYGKEIQIFELDKEGKPFRIIAKPVDLPPGKISDVVWHPNGEFLVYLNQEEGNLGLIRMVTDGPTGQIIRQETLNEPLKIGGRLSMVKFTPDARYVIVLDRKKELTDQETNTKGELFVVRLHTNLGEKHALLSKAAVGENPINFEFNSEGNYLIAANQQRSFLPPDKFVNNGQSSISVLQIDLSGNIKNLVNFPIDGILPNGLSFDKTGNNIAVSVYQYLTFGYSFGGIEFFKFDPKANPILQRQPGKIFVPRGIHSLKAVFDF